MSTSASARRCANDRGGHRTAGRVRAGRRDRGLRGGSRCPRRRGHRRARPSRTATVWTWRLRRSWISPASSFDELVVGDAAPAPRQLREVIGRHRRRRSSTKTSSLRAYSGSRWRTIGASTSTCAHDMSPARNASPVRSCSRVKPGHAHQPRRRRPRDRRPVRQPRPRAQRPVERPIRPGVPLPHRPDDLRLEALRHLEQLDQLIRPCRARPLPPVLGRQLLDRQPDLLDRVITEHTFDSTQGVRHLQEVDSELVRHPLDALPRPVARGTRPARPASSFRCHGIGPRSSSASSALASRAACAEPGSTARPHVGQAPSARTVDGDRNRSQVAHHGTGAIPAPDDGRGRYWIRRTGSPSMNADHVVVSETVVPAG